MVKWKENCEIIFLVAIVITVTSAVPYKPFESDISVLDNYDDSIRLPKTVIPVHYDLWLTTNVHTSDRAITGNLKILVKVLNQTNSITLHNRGLIITYMELKLVDSDDLIEISYSADASRDFLIISTGEVNLQSNREYLIEIKYSGNLRIDNGGFYRSIYYVTGETLPRYVAATQFQSTSARTAFPCFDEPALKATFKLAITHATHYEAISNMNSYRTNNNDETTTTAFDETPIMSSYLLAFVVSDFAYRSLYNGPSTTEHRVYAREEDVENVALSLRNSDLFLRTLEKYCDYVYELPKMYSAAIPDFAAGAMENWGLVLYKEQYLIVNEQSHPREVFDMLRVTAHELAHQFFGNVVTYDWWDKIWLNEGFAAFFEYFLPTLTHQNERFRDHFNVRKVQNAFRRDSLHSTAPMTFDGDKPSEINYDKGGSVIRMFQYSIGDDLFRTALNKYLNDNHHRPVATEDLLKAFEDVLEVNGKIPGLDFSKAFKTWELQKGYPMITVTYSSAKQFLITQQHYLSVTEERDPEDDSSWYIPLSYTTAANPNFENIIFSDYFVDKTAQKVISTANISDFDDDDWFIFNIQQIGFYRVNYDENNWEKIIKILNSDKFQQIHVLNRAQLVDDALTFAFDGFLSYEIALGVVSYLERETDYIPWYPASMAFEKLNYILKDTPLQYSFKRFIRKLMRRNYVSNGLQHVSTDTIFKQFSRDLSIDFTCKMGDQGCLDYAYSQLSKDIPKPLQLSLHCNGLKGFNRHNEFVNIYRKFQVSTDQNDRIRYLDILMCSSDQKALGDLLETTLGSSKDLFYRSHELSRLFANIIVRSDVGMTAMFEFMLRFYDDIRSRHGNVFDGWLIAASRRIASPNDEYLIFSTMDKIEAMGKTLGANTRNSVTQNIKSNRDWTSSYRYRDSLYFIENYLKAIDDEESRLRLPDTSEPLLYRIKLDVPEIHVGTMGFSGEVSIEVGINKNTDRIMLHSKRHVINDLKVSDKSGNEIQVLEYSTQTAGESLTIYFMDMLTAGTKITVNIKYLSSLNGPNDDFYFTYYTVDGERKYLAATQFQPAGARHAFPCYDEPGFKTPFELSISHDKSYTAIANTFGFTYDNGDGSVTTEFERTPMMSSYLVAFVISDFSVITNERTRQTHETLHRIWTKPDSISKANYGLDNSIMALKALEEYCYFEYPLPKVDSAAIPLKNSAMENWGMVTYWETAMIYQEDYNNISHSMKYSGVTVIAHELAHQFFGNAVTCQWWSQVWLNEGFANLFEHILLDLFEPTWRINHFMTAFSVQNRALISDSRDNTRPMTFDVNTVSEIDNAFDGVAYQKSGSVLRMYLHAVGEDIFRRSLERYLKTNNYKPVTSQHLLDAIVETMKENRAYNFDIERSFRTWEHQKGYPLLNVHYNPTTRAFHLTQERFFEYKKINSEDESSWHIPINYATSINPNFTDTKITNFFEDSTAELQIPIANLDPTSWYVFNKQQFGFYRVNYDEANWRSLGLVLNSDQYSNVHIMNRIQIIDDAFALAKGGYIEYSIPYDIIKYLDREDDFFPWYTIYRYVNSLFTVYGNKNQKLIKFFNKLSEKFYKKYKLPVGRTVPIENVPERYGRDYANFYACNNGNKECLEDAHILVQEFASKNQLIPNGLERIYCSGFRGTGKQELFNDVWKIMSNTEDSAFKLLLINALGCTDDQDLLKSYLDSSIGDTNNVNYTSSEKFAVFNAVLSSYSSLPIVIDFLKREQNEAIFNYRTSLMQILRNIANTIRDEQDQLQFHSFLMTRTELSGDDFLTVSRIVSDNIDRQKSVQNMNHMSQIERILNEWENGVSDVGQVWRLPKSSKPTYYKVDLDVRNIHTGDRAYSGSTIINIDILEKTNYVIFHSKAQVIHEIFAFDSSSPMDVDILANYRLVPSYDTIVVYFQHEMPAGSTVRIFVKYSTSLVVGTTGFYQTSYSMYGRTRYIGTTQFERTGARFAFPCYDEPEYKAVFELSFIHDQSVTVYSNTFGDSTENRDETVTTQFGPSPIMSSYLNAFVVSDLKHIDNSLTKLDNETLHRIIVREDSLTKAPYALENSILSLKALEEYIGYKYELPKVDSAGVPGKSSSMENWGMVIYRENAMIYDENYQNIPHTQKFSGVRVISHELAHQFFGNSITCIWWSHIWLNEGFAQLLQYTLTDMFQKDWRMQDFMNVLAVQSTAFRVDARNTTRPMTVEVTTIGEIESVFDSIAYDKSASVLRTFEYAVGEKIFRDSLNHFITTYDHMPTDSQNLIDSFKTTMQKNNFSNFDFERAFRTWETQKGYPVIHVSYDTQDSAFHIQQERFFEDKGLKNNDDSSWYIPLSFATQQNPDFIKTLPTEFFLNGENEKIIPANPGSWYVFNKQQRSYYRVNYDQHNWNALSSALTSNDYASIHVMNRAQLIDDSFALVTAGYLDDYQTAFNILKYLTNEDDYFPWYTANRYIAPLYTVFGSKNEALNTFVRKLSVKFYAKYRLPPDNIIAIDSLPERYGRELAINLACSSGNEQCLKDAFTLVQLFAARDTPIPKGLETILCHGLRGTGKQDEFVQIWRKMQMEVSGSADKTTLLNALGCSDDPVALKDYLESTLGTASNQVNYTQAERRAVFNAVLKSDSSLPVVINFLTQFEADVISRYGWTLQTILTTVGNTIRTAEDQVMFSNYILSLPNLSSSSLSTILKSMSGNMRQQTSFQNARQMEIIKTIASEWEFGVLDGHQLRLPKTSKPDFYKIHLDVRNVHTGAKDYTGDVMIDITMLEASNRVMFHSKNQVIHEIKAFEKASLRQLKISSYRLFPSADTILIYFDNALNSGAKISVSIKYSTSLLSSSFGFYQTSYEMYGITRYVAATQFEPARARYAFPCYDEPEYKAVFDVSFTHDHSVKVYGNTMEHAVAENDGSGLFKTYLKPTPIMSSYLIAFVVSDFTFIDNSETKGPDEVLQRILISEDSVEKADFGLKTSESALKALEDYVGFKYDLEKLDSVMIPGKGGAMENWGLITYVPSALVYELNPKDSSHTQILNGVTIISHEVAHQFFGNAVTCHWWNHIWLNEGFADFLQYKLSDMFYPEWRFMDFMNVMTVHNAFINDAVNSTRAMTTDALTIDEISRLFDNIAYDKSGSVLRMFEYVIGESLYRQALNLYVNKNNLKSAISQDLIDAFVETLSKIGSNRLDFDRAFKTWENTKGYPVITVNYLPDIDSFQVTQEKFYRIKEQRADDGSSWYIPLNYATAKNPNFADTSITDFFVDGAFMWNILAPQHDSNSWFVFNKQQRSYYRVNYDANNWKLLSNALNSNDYNKIHVMNRAQLIDDSFALVSAGYLDDYETAYDIFKYLVNEDDFFPWYTANRQISPLYNVFGIKNAVLNNFVENISKKFYAKYKLASNGLIPEEILPERYGRAYATNLACNAGNENCRQDTLTLVRNYADKNQKIPKGLENILCLGMRGTGKQDVFLSVWNIAQNTTDDALKITLLNALGCTDDEVALFDYLESIFGSVNSVRYTLTTRQAVFRGALQSKVIVPVFVKFMKKHPDWALSYLRQTTAQLITSVAYTVKTREDQVILIDYMASANDLAGGDFKSISTIMSSALSQQQQPQYARQIHLMAMIFPLDPKDDETTLTPRTTQFTASTTKIEDETSTITLTTTIGSVTTTLLPFTSTLSQITSTLQPINTTLSPVTSTLSSITTTLPPTPIQSTPPAITTPTTTQKAESTTPDSATSVGIKISTIIVCVAMAMLFKF